MTAGARNLYIHIEDCHDTYGAECVAEAIAEYYRTYHNLGPQRSPSSLRSVEAQARQAKAEFDTPPDTPGKES